MIKLIFVGLWACAITLLSSWAVMSWKTAKATQVAHEADAHAPVSEEFRSKMISVPIIADGAIQGYVVAQFNFTLDGKVLKRLSIKPEAVLLDEAFNTIYAGEKIDFRAIKKQDLPALLKTIGDNVNKRFGAQLVERTMIQELNYVPRAEARMSEKREFVPR